MTDDIGQLRCSASSVASGAAFTRWIRRRGNSADTPSRPLAGARAAIEVIRRAPRLSVELSTSASGAHIRDFFLARRRGLRSHLYARNVLRIPPAGEPMFRGRSYRAARTNIRRARPEGITCRELPKPERLRALRN